MRCGVFFIESMSHETLLQTTELVADVAAPSSLSTTLARFEQTQLHEQLCTTGRFCTVILALATIPLRSMHAREATLILCLQRVAIPAAGGSQSWPWIYVKLRPAGRLCQRMGLKVKTL